MGGQGVDLAVLVLVPGEAVEGDVLPRQLGHRLQGGGARDGWLLGLLPWLLRSKLLVLLLELVSIEHWAPGVGFALVGDLLLPFHYTSLVGEHSLVPFPLQLEPRVRGDVDGQGACRHQHPRRQM